MKRHPPQIGTKLFYLFAFQRLLAEKKEFPTPPAVSNSHFPHPLHKGRGVYKRARASPSPSGGLESQAVPITFFPWPSPPPSSNPTHRNLQPAIINRPLDTTRWDTVTCDSPRTRPPPPPRNEGHSSLSHYKRGEIYSFLSRTYNGRGLLTNECLSL